MKSRETLAPGDKVWVYEHFPLDFPLQPGSKGVIMRRVRSEPGPYWEVRLNGGAETGYYYSDELVKRYGP